MTHQVIDAFGLAKYSQDKFRERSDQFRRHAARGFSQCACGEVSRDCIMMIHVLVLGIGSHMAFTDKLTIGSLASFQALFLTLSVSLL